MSIFEGIGKIGDYVRLRNLQREMRYRVKTGGSLAQAMGAPVQPGKLKSNELQKSKDLRDANREGLIRQKLRQGRKLSASDLQYLKENNPDLYEKVTRIEERREMLARALKRAKTKEEALRAVAQANIAVLAEMKSGGGDTPSFHGAGTGSTEGISSAPVMAAGGEAAAGDAPGTPLSEGGNVAPTTGDMQGAIGREAVTKDSGASTTAHTNAGQSEERTGEEQKKGFQPGPSTRDPYGNRRVLSREEMDDMLRQAQNAGKLTPLDDEKVYLLRALQREWMEYASSDDYKNLPNAALDAAKEEARGVRRKKHGDADPVPVRVVAPQAAEIFAAAHRYYHTAQDGERFFAKG